MITRRLYQSALLLMIVFSVPAFDFPQGKYCGKILNNEFDIYFNNGLSLANVSATIFRKPYKCDDEEYTYNKNDFSIMMSTDPDDCLNLVLKKYNLCPCPLELEYNQDKNRIEVLDTESGTIKLTSCS